jgi:predicted DCC family thiol-disulfide oxidoreductase YuxK
MSVHPAIILFDGECGFCHRSVKFIIARDPSAIFRFVPKNSPAGLRLLTQAGLDPALQSMILLEPGKAWIKSDAALRIASFLQPPWNLLAILRCVPRVVRDLGYSIIARLRHHLAPRPSCSLADMPCPDRFLPTQ